METGVQRNAVKCLVVVAHPDDETIWMGGTILRHRDWDWTILSLCRADDPVRAPRFRLAASELGAAPLISDLDDSPDLAPLSRELREIRERIWLMTTDGFELVFTHGRHGEYTRHERHEQVHRAVREMLERGELRGELVSFAYDDCGGGCTPRPARGADLLIALSPAEFALKRHIIHDVYGFRAGSFESNSAGPTEAFTVKDDQVREMISSSERVEP